MFASCTAALPAAAARKDTVAAAMIAPWAAGHWSCPLSVRKLVSSFGVSARDGDRLHRVHVLHQLQRRRVGMERLLRLAAGEDQIRESGPNSDLPN